MEHKHKHLESKECDLIKPFVDKNIYIKKGLPKKKFLFSSKGSEHIKWTKKYICLKSKF
jgi:hypothetical protein